MKTSEYFDDKNEQTNLTLNTEEMGIGDIHPLLERLFHETKDQQFLRELVQNSIESGAKDIVICPDWNHVEESEGKAYRYMQADNGVGMTPQELVHYMNSFSCSGNENGVSVHDDNFGVGAKISSLGWNKNGMLIFSWKDNIGKVIKLWKDPSTGKYGMRRFKAQDENGQDIYVSVLDAPDSYKHPIIEDHGTVIVLCGNDAEEDTYYGPNEKGSTYSHTLDLNLRYFSLPEGVKISVHALPASRENWPVSRTAHKTTTPRIAKKRWLGGNRNVKGTNHYLEKISREHGTLTSPDFKIHWYYTSKSNKRVIDTGVFTKSPFIATLYQNEVYDMIKGREALKYFSIFGLYRKAVSDNTYLIVEPNPKTATSEGVYTDTARSRLLHTSYRDTGTLPWERYADFFKANMPDIIKRAMEDSDVNPNDSSNSMIKKDLQDLLRKKIRQNYKLQDEGNEALDTNLDGPGDLGAGSNGLSRPLSTPVGVGDQGNDPTMPATTKRIVRRKSSVNTGESKARKINPKNEIPEIRWVGEDEEGGLLGFAARYDKNNHLIFINKDFKGFKSLNHLTFERYNVSIPENKLKDTTQRVWGRFIAARVLSVYEYKDSEFWTGNQWENATSPEALTMAIADGFNLDKEVNMILRHYKMASK